MKSISKQIMNEFFERLGSQYPKQANLYILGGSAMIVLGSLRDTLDIDYVGDDIQKDEFQTAVEDIANELELETEAVPIDRFIPLPEGNETRGIRIGQFGNVTVHIFDPYSIALSKIDRGFEADIEDVIFLIENKHISAIELERVVKDGLSHAGKFDFHPEILEHFESLKKRLKSV